MNFNFEELVNADKPAETNNDRLDKAIDEVKEFLKELFHFNQSNQGNGDKIAVTYGAIANFLSAKTDRKYRAMGLMTWLGPRLGSKALQALIVRADTRGIDPRAGKGVLSWYNKIFGNIKPQTISHIPTGDESEINEVEIDLDNPDF